MAVVMVDDLDDPRLADYRHLREPNVRARVERNAGIFTVEGWLSLEALAESLEGAETAYVVFASANAWREAIGLRKLVDSQFATLGDLEGDDEEDEEVDDEQEGSVESGAEAVGE